MHKSRGHRHRNYNGLGPYVHHAVRGPSCIAGGHNVRLLTFSCAETTSQVALKVSSPSGDDEERRQALRSPAPSGCASASHAHTAQRQTWRTVRGALATALDVTAQGGELVGGALRTPWEQRALCVDRLHRHRSCGTCPIPRLRTVHMSSPGLHEWAPFGGTGYVDAAPRLVRACAGPLSGSPEARVHRRVPSRNSNRALSECGPFP